MLDKRLLWTTGALVIVTMTAVVAMALPVNQGEIIHSQENVSDVEVQESPGQQENTKAVYLLREHQGRIGVFINGTLEPEMVLDVLVKHLPEYDQKQLKQGIMVADYDALIALIEDFSS